MRHFPSCALALFALSLWADLAPATEKTTPVVFARINPITEAVKKTKNPVLKRELETLHSGVGEGSEEEAFRQNPKLRETVIWEIVRQNAPHFQKIRDKFLPQIASGTAALTQLSAAENLKFEVRQFLEGKL